MPPQNPWKTQIIELVNRGLDLIHPVDQVPGEYFSRLTNVESVLEGDIRSRPGVSLINSSAITSAAGAAGFGDGLTVSESTSAAMIAIISGAGAGTEGSYVEIIAATAQATRWITFILRGDGGNTEVVELDLAIGAGGSEVNFLTDFVSRVEITAVDGEVGPIASFAFTLASGVRIAARCKDQDGSARTYSFHMTIMN